MNFLHKKNTYYYMVILVFIASALVAFLIYNNIASKEKKIGLAINLKINELENAQKRIAESINSMKNIELPILRYGYSFNENNSYFISEIVNISKRSRINLSNVKLIQSHKNKNTAIYLFKVSGIGKPSSIYSFIKALEFNYKIQLKKFYISKSISKGKNVFFSSVLAAYVINKPEVLSGIAKLKTKLSLPGNFAAAPSGVINPFVNIPEIKRTSEVLKMLKRKHLRKALIRRKKTRVAENVYKKLKVKYNIKKSNYFNKKGVAFFNENNFNKAMAMFKKSMMLNPNNYMALSNAALDSYETKNYNRAVFYAKKALELKKLWQINFILGLAYLHNENFSKAEYNFLIAAKLNPSNSNIKYYLNIAKKGR